MLNARCRSCQQFRLVSEGGIDFGPVETDSSGLCSHCVLELIDPTPAELCDECGVETAAYDGLCLECQCNLHAVGAYDMDGQGWRV